MVSSHICKPSVVIVGGGLAGLATAALLARAGRSAFIQASASGNMQLLLDMLASDVALYSDGGESLVPTHGAEAVARSLLGAIQRVSGDTQWRWRPAAINGRGGMLFYAYGRLYAVLAFEFEQGRMQEIDIVVSPEKLRHLQSS